MQYRGAYILKRRMTIEGRSRLNLWVEILPFFINLYFQLYCKKPSRKCRLANHDLNLSKFSRIDTKISVINKTWLAKELAFIFLNHDIPVLCMTESANFRVCNFSGSEVYINHTNGKDYNILKIYKLRRQKAYESDRSSANKNAYNKS